MRSLLKYLKDYKKESILAPVFKMLEASFELFVPLVMAAIIDTGIANHDKGYIFRMGGVLVALGLIGLACSVTAQFFSAKAAVGFATKLRHALFSHIQGLSYAELDTLGTNTLITRMTSDVNQLQSGVNLTLRLLLRSPFIVFGAMIMAFTVDVKAALIFVVAIPLLSIVVFGIMIVSLPLYKKVQAALDKVLGRTRENLEGARVIRAFCKEGQEIESFSEENEALLNIQVFVGKISAAMNPLTYIIVNIALVVLLWTGAIRVDGGIITQGAVVALVNYMSQILVELVKLANLIITISKALACANRILSLIHIFDEICSNGESIAVLSYTIQLLESFTNKVPFLFGYIFAIFSFSSNYSIDGIMNKSYLAQHITYLLNSSKLLGGSTIGTAISAEFYEFGQGNYLVVFILSILLLMIANLFIRKMYKNPMWFYFAVSYIQNLFLSPRGSVMKIFSKLSLAYIVIFIFLSIFFRKRGTDNEY